MNPPTLAPKIHPLARGVEAEDPLELLVEAAPGDPNVMLECIVQEFAWMGWDSEQIFALFHNVNYPVLNQLLALFGEDEIRSRLAALTTAVGVMRVTEAIDEKEDSDDPELIQLTLRRH